MITYGPDYYVVEVKYETEPPDRHAYKKKQEWTRAIRKRFRHFNDREFKTEQAAKMFAGKIRKAFPEAPLEIVKRFNLYF